MLNVHVSGINELQANLNALLALNKDEQMLDDISKKLESKVRQGFRSGTDPYGEAWAQSTDSTPLIDTGNLMRSIDGSVRAGQILLGTDVDYAEKHQNGWGITARPFLPDEDLPDDWFASINKVVTRYINAI
ncbi:phage virion morphogenesis protein [Vibrio parahaemolyticus]|nr:phage virion morphogenesis protein [Vibrio parahaemolyticus]